MFQMIVTIFVLANCQGLIVDKFVSGGSDDVLNTCIMLQMISLNNSLFSNLNVFMVTSS